MTDKKILTTPVGKVGFYALDRPFRDSGKFSVTILLDLDSAEAKAFQKEVGKNASVVEKIVDGKPVLQIGASTRFDTFIVSDAEGNRIAAPTDVRSNLGDVMMAKMSVSAYNYEYNGKKGSALNLLGIKILSHDKTNRAEVEGEKGGLEAKVLEALSEENKLAAMKG